MLERMHAVVQQAFGGPEVLEVAEIDRPVPLATEVLVRVEAVWSATWTWCSTPSAARSRAAPSACCARAGY